MPSDSKKKRDQKKKEDAKKKVQPKKKQVDSEEQPCDNGEELEGVDVENGDETNGNGVDNGVNGLAKEIDELDLAAEKRAVTGVLASHPDSRDVRIINTSITFHGAELLVDAELVLNSGRRYGLIGLNGCGKSSLLSVLGNREVPIPGHIDIFHLRREMAPSDKTALECVMEVDEERMRLEHEAELLAVKNTDEAHDCLMDIYERLEDMDVQKAETRAAEILHGLGFTKKMQNKKVKDFSGGWRMRIALARALFVMPDMMLLDEPTNHLDLDACVWLEQYLKTYKRILVIISHSQDFLNGVCTNIIHMHRKKLKYYGGNYDQYVQTRLELEENQMKRFKWEQDQISNMKNYIARFGHGSAKLARQAKSKEKTLNRMVEGGLAESVVNDKNVTFSFPDCDQLPPPVIQVQKVSFKYSPNDPYIYENLEFGVDLDTRVALVGANGAGKSTLLKLIASELIPTDGLIRRHSHLKIGRYHQHLQDILDPEMSALNWMMKSFPDVKEIEEMRRMIGRFGLTGQQQICPMKNLSDGQRCRVIFSWLAFQTPHMLLMDEPTNHLDMETIDALALALLEFNGGVLLVSHDFRLISQVAEEIWVCANGTVSKWQGDIFSYKQSLIDAIETRKSKEKKKAAANQK